MNHNNGLERLGIDKKYVESLPENLFSIVSKMADKMAANYETNSAEFIKAFTHDSDFKVPDELWPLLGENTGIEVWSGGAQPYFLFSNLKFMLVSSYSLEEIRIHKWTDLFERDKIHELQCLSAVERAIITRKLQTNVTPEHFVKEKLPGHNNVAIVRVSAICPFFVGEESVPMGIIALTEYKMPIGH